MGAKWAAENAPSISANAFDDFQCTGLTGYDVPSKKSAPSIVLTVRFFQKIGRLGAQARIDNSTAEQRRKWARRAAIARWRKASP
jgi:hypothetical protein